MNSRIIKDYFAGFRWDNLKSKAANYQFWMIYFAVLLPMTGGFYEKPTYTITYYLIAIPILHMINAGAIHIMRLPKILHLVPLSREMKREYIVKSALFRIGFGIFIGIIFTIPLVVTGISSWKLGLLLIFNIVVLSLLLCGMNVRYGACFEAKWQAYKDSRELCQQINIAITFISSYGIACMLCWDYDVADWVKWIFIGVAVLLQLPLTIKHMLYWNKAVERSISYEESYDK